MAILSFRDAATQDINYARISKDALRRLPRQLHEKARIKLARLHPAATLSDLATLTGDRIGQFSIRLNDRYRICFRWSPRGAAEVEIVDYH